MKSKVKKVLVYTLDDPAIDCVYFLPKSVDKVENDDNEDKKEMGNFSLLDYYLKMSKNSIVIYYRGPFTKHILAEISKDIREKIKINMPSGKKVFSIFIELAQNISLYSAERNQYGEGENLPGNGTFVITETDNNYTLTSANLIRNEVSSKIMDKCTMINSSDKNELRNMKKELRKLPHTSGRDGANIGLVDIALKANNQLNTNTYKLNDQHSFFSLSVEVSK